MTENKRIVLIANIQILETLSKHLTQRGYEILRQLPMVTATSLNDIKQLKPDCIILSEGSQFDDDYTLLKAIQTIKSQNRARIIVHTQTRKIGDSLLSDLVTLNVYDFIAFSSFDLTVMFHLLENPNEYADVAEYHNYAKESATLDQPLAMPSVIPEEISLLKPPVVIAIEPIEPIQVKTKMFGTTIISVSGLQHGSGTTHTALTIAKFLSDKGFKAAVVELKQKNDYGLIYLPSKETYSGTSFKYENFDIYANDGEVNTDELMIAAMSKNYHYIVLDAGLIFRYDLENAKLDTPNTQIKKFEKGTFYNEIMKADFKLINSFASIQYADSLEYLMNYLNVWEITEMKLLFNFTNEKAVTNYKDCTDSEVFITPFNFDTPLTEEQIGFYSRLLEEILPQENVRGTQVLKSIGNFVSSMGNLVGSGISKVPTMIRRKSLK